MIWALSIFARKKLESVGYTPLHIDSSRKPLHIRSRSTSSKFTHFSTSYGFFIISMACCCVSRLMLYGYFTLLKTSMISFEANAIPNRMAAHPHALLKVLSTMRLGYFASSSLNGFCFEKSL